MSADVAVPAGTRSRVAARRVAASWHIPALVGVLALAAFLDLYRLGQNAWANDYYAGAVRSMLKSWHNFFFVSFDPGGLVSVDKPPLALWLEAASAKVFGFSTWGILLPEALAGVAAVWLLYLLVTRYFGRVAGLAAALALAVSPVSVSVNRDNNPDALLALLLIAAAYVGARAVESGRLWTLLSSAALVGLAFNTKMLAAMVVVPGLAVAYLAFARVPSWKRRIVHLLAAGAVLVVISGAWIAAVDLTPAVDRPYVGSTSDNSAFSLAFDYNGLGRVVGQTGGTSFGGGGGLGGAFSGTPGVFRLLNDSLGDQGAWLLPLAIVGGLSALGMAIHRRRRRELGTLTIVGGWFAAAAVVFSFSSGIIHTYYLSALAPATCGLVGIGVVALWRDSRDVKWMWLPLVALGLSAWLEVTLLRRSGYQSWLQVLVIAGCAVAAGLILASALPRLRGRRITRVAVGLGFAALLAAPIAWSSTTTMAPVNGVFPGAGPSFVSGLSSRAGGGFGFGFGAFRGRAGGTGPIFRPRNGRFGPPPGGFRGGAPPAGGRFPFPRGGFRGGEGFRGGGGFGGADSTQIAQALAYAKAHNPGTRWALIVSSEQAAAPSVIKGESVAAMGGFTGRETVLTSSYLSRLVRSGEARYFLLGPGGFGPFGGNNAAVSTITSTCKQVSTISSLYDCAGKAAAIAAS